MQKHFFFSSLFLLFLLSACQSGILNPNAKISADVNGASWHTNNFDAISFNPSTGRLLIKATDNGQQIQLFAENLKTVGNSVSFSLSQTLGSGNLYCSGFDSLGNPTSMGCTSMNGFSIENTGLKWLIRTSCEQNLAGFELFSGSDSSLFEKIAAINAVGNSQAINDYSWLNTTTPSVGRVWLKTKVIAANGMINYSSTSIVDLNGVFVNNQNVANYCGGTITLSAHDSINRSISGTFTLNTTDANGNTVNISNGEFKNVSY